MRYLPLLLISSIALAVPTAQQAREQAAIVGNARTLHEITLLWADAEKEINEAISHGLFETNVLTNHYNLDAIHAVNVRLRKLGYKCEWIDSGFGDMILISWEPK